MIFLILGLLLGTLVGFFTATLMVCAAHNEREDAIKRFSAAGRMAGCDSEDRGRAVAAGV